MIEEPGMKWNQIWYNNCIESFISTETMRNIEVHFDSFIHSLCLQDWLVVGVPLKFIENLIMALHKQFLSAGD